MPTEQVPHQRPLAQAGVEPARLPNLDAAWLRDLAGLEVKRDLLTISQRYIAPTTDKARATDRADNPSAEGRHSGDDAAGTGQSSDRAAPRLQSLECLIKMPTDQSHCDARVRWITLIGAVGRGSKFDATV